MKGYLQHHGIKGQRWGVRRYQNEDGTLTPAGEKHVAKQQLKSDLKQMRKDRRAMTKEEIKKHDLTKSINFNYLMTNLAGSNNNPAGRMMEMQKFARDREVKQIVNQRMMEKYGSEKMSSLAKSDRVREGAAYAASLGILAGSAVAVGLTAARDAKRWG